MRRKHQFDNGPWLESHGYRRFVALRLLCRDASNAPNARAAQNVSLCNHRLFGFLIYYQRYPAVMIISGDAQRFATTRWTRVTIASDPASPAARAALEQLCQDYWPPLFAFALRQGRDSHTAQDLTQAFFAHFLERGYLRAADRTRGRFRTFLLTCFQHFLIHEWEKKQAVKRGGQFVLVSWEEQSAGLESRAVSAASMPPEKLYDREWALNIMERGLTRLRAEFVAAGRDRHFEILGQFLHSEPGPGEYLGAGQQLDLPHRAVKLAVHRMRRRYGRLVREEVRETVTSESEVDDEMRYLVELMCR
jgi:RNA polymerase sigma-70 factor (ECF subfamily)